jgi:hypothetical protein
MHAWVAALWQCVDGYTGLVGNDLKCGGFTSQQDIQAFCETTSGCAGYSYSAAPEEPGQWWCAKTTASAGKAYTGGKWSSLHTTYVNPFRARYHHGDVQAGTTAAWLLRTLSPRSLPAWKGRCRSLSIPTRRQGACTTASRFGSAQPMVISGGFAVAIAPASGRFLGQTLSGSLSPRQEILATTSAKLS